MFRSKSYYAVSFAYLLDSMAQPHTTEQYDIAGLGFGFAMEME